MRKCITLIIVKIRGNKKRKLSKKRKLNANKEFINFTETLGKIYKCCENRGNYAIRIIGLAPWSIHHTTQKYNRCLLTHASAVQEQSYRQDVATYDRA